ncbi:hypothetical protein H4R33_005602 [Dimargaris cristalligena]|uniref:SHSP domain-containing protein n=1 Tax=Dimargaris cristalligena TaxID=215637 RepID=A0A4P9ZT41_9FUNG|nr:hypothetical protein H4R33_005602 [Dimargaris cristalligena]RKP36673.1 hypothetical protein BJ085DRAFT_39453 [Dimargaris cristalligena]|eukprot:RKP36673.1 hypothetical protein BJ085DRAFT_39453 [Dimargaris cristalligena]
MATCTPFCDRSFFDLHCCHKLPILTPCAKECTCFRVNLKVETAKPADPPAPAPAPPPPTPNPQCVFTVPIQRPKNPPPPAFDVDENEMRFQVTMKWDICNSPVKCDVTVVNHTVLLIRASFSTDKKDTFDVFERTVQIPNDTVSEKSEGKYKDGVLVVQVPKLDSWKRFYV